MNESTGARVPYGDIERGVAVGRGRVVVLEDDDLAAAAPRATRTIELLDFVGGDEVDPLYFASPYYLAPENEAARRPYALFAAAIAKAHRVGIATFVMREREHLCAVRSRGPLVMLETMHFGDEVRAAPDELAGLDEAEPRARELDMALSLVESMVDEFDPERIDELAAVKARGEEGVLEEEPVLLDAKIIDLVSALWRSVDRARERRRAGGAPGEGPGAPAGESANGDGEASALASRSRKELYERARAAGIPGHSKMRRDDLLAALQTIEQRGRRRRRPRAS